MKATRTWLPFALALPLFALFASLGVWQLQRLRDRRADNEVREAALSLPVVEWPATEPRDAMLGDAIVGRRVSITGRWAPNQELVVRGHAYLGTPGVYVLTPLVVDPRHSVLVLRGWLPAADGLSADLPGAVPINTRDPVTVRGLARAGQNPVPIPVRRVNYEDWIRPVLGNIDLVAADSLLPLELATFVVQVLPNEQSSEGRSGMPVPIPAPELNDGPHALYAFQWFGFALIALAGAIFLPRAARAGAVPTPGPGDES
jgi:cytochrome oxidase assembly protein ShyY1